MSEGKPDEDADCFFKSSKKMFLDVWEGKHTPTAKDFLTGAIKSNNPMLLKEFVAAFALAGSSDSAAGELPASPDRPALRQLSKAQTSRGGFPSSPRGRC